MERPRPKEIAIQMLDGGVLQIYTSNEDAYRWIEREAPLFGQAFPPIFQLPYWLLNVAPTFDTNEVRAYLLSYGDGAE